MKKAFFVLAIVAMSFAANAQKSKASASEFKIGIGPRIGVVVGDYDQIFGLAIGGELQGEYMISTDASITGATGYTNFSGKNNFSSAGFVPVLVGARYYPSSQFFFAGRLGASFYTGMGGGTWFTYEPQVGYNGSRVQVALGYNGASKNSVTLAHVGLSAIIKLN